MSRFEPRLYKFIINGVEITDCSYEVTYDNLERLTMCAMKIPALEAATRLLAEVDTAPSLDFVVRNWEKA